MKLVCPDCGRQYESGKFCLECGGKLQEITPELVCPSCGYKAKFGKFCPECGIKLTEQIVTVEETSNPKSVERTFNEKDPLFAKYYDKKGFPRTIPQEERDVAIEELTPFANQDIPEAKMLLGGILMRDSNMDTILKGARLIKEAEEAGDKLAYYLMGIVYFYGAETVVEQNHDESEKRLLEEYQEYQDGDTAGFLANLYTVSSEKCDYKKAFEYATIAAEDDADYGYFVLGTLYLNGWGVTKDVQQALENFKLSAAYGNETSMNQIGFIYMGNEGIEENPEQSFYWYNEAAQKGSDVGAFNLGCCYRDGYGVEQEAEKAAEWFKKAAEKGYVNAIYELGAYYQEILVDYEKAKMWYLKAAEMGYSEGQNKLAVLYSDAFNDYEEAIKWYRKAVEQDNPNAFRNYAWCLWNGNGVKANKKKAIEMMQRALELGYPDAEKELQEMQGGLSDTAYNKQGHQEENLESNQPNEWIVPDGTKVLNNKSLPSTTKKWRNSIEVIYLPESLQEIDIWLDNGELGEESDLLIFPNLQSIVIPTGKIEEFCKMSFYINCFWEKVTYEDGTHVFPEASTFLEAFSSCEVTDYLEDTLANTYDETNVVVSPKCECIKSKAFKGTGLNNIYIPDSVRIIEKQAFKDCKQLNSIRLSDNLDTITKEMFYGCEKLKEIEIPKGISTIEEGAFYGCKSLASVTLPSTIISIENGGFWEFNPFQQCPNLKKIIVPKGTKTYFQNLLKGFSGNPAQYLVESKER